MKTLQVSDEFLESLPVLKDIISASTSPHRDKLLKAMQCFQMKPCPHCGVTEIEYEEFIPGYLLPQCQKCRACGPSVNKRNEDEILMWWNDQVGELGECRWCGAAEKYMFCDGDDENGYFIVCPDCDAYGPEATSPEEAWEKWRA